MDLLLNRYRNLTVLLAAVIAQLLLLAYQVKSNQDVPLIRVWAFSAVTPLARVLDGARRSTETFFRDYFVLLDVREENKRLKSELDRIQIDNQQLRAELSTADRARSLAIFQQESPMKTVAAHIIANTTDLNGKAVLIDRGVSSGIQKGMAVITPDGIVGKVISVYRAGSAVLLITDPAFAAGVVSQKNRVHGTLKGQGNDPLIVDYVQNEENVEPGEMFYTAGDDGVFPRGLPVGTASVVRPGRIRKEISLTPSGFRNGLEEVLVIVEGVHTPIPEVPAANQPVYIQPPPPADGDGSGISLAPLEDNTAETDLDRQVERTKRIGEQQKHVFGERGTGAPNFNLAPAPAEPKPDAKGPADPRHP
jgi:rod shape-determining protein MreC